MQHNQSLFVHIYIGIYPVSEKLVEIVNVTFPNALQRLTATRMRKMFDQFGFCKLLMDGSNNQIEHKKKTRPFKGKKALETFHFSRILRGGIQHLRLGRLDRPDLYYRYTYKKEGGGLPLTPSTFIHLSPHEIRYGNYYSGGFFPFDFNSDYYSFHSRINSMNTNYCYIGNLIGEYE